MFSLSLLLFKVAMPIYAHCALYKRVTWANRSWRSTKRVTRAYPSCRSLRKEWLKQTEQIALSLFRTQEWTLLLLKRKLKIGVIISHFCCSFAHGWQFALLLYSTLLFTYQSFAALSFALGSLIKRAMRANCSSRFLPKDWQTSFAHVTLYKKSN